MHYTKSTLLALTFFQSAIRFAFKINYSSIITFNISLLEIQSNILIDALMEMLSN